MGYIVAKECPVCQCGVDAEVDALHGQVVCTECATVLEDQYIDDTQDVRIFDDNQDAQRVEKLWPGEQSGKQDLTSVRIEGQRGLDKTRDVKAREREDAHTKQISQIAATLGPSCTAEIKHQAQDILREVIRNAPIAFRGKYGIHQVAVYAACIYIAARTVNSMVTMAELQLVDRNLGQHHINKACKFIREKVPKIAAMAAFEIPDPPRPPRPPQGQIIETPRFESREAAHMEQISHFASLLGPHLCPPRVLQQAQHIFHRLMESGTAPLSGSQKITLRGIYAACLYVAARQVAKMICAADFTAKVTDLRTVDIICAWMFLRQKVPAVTAIYFRGLNYFQPEQQFHITTTTITTAAIRTRTFDQHIRAPVLRLCKALKFSFKEKQIAEELSDAVAKGAHINKKPASVAAAIIWVCSLLLNRNSTADLEIISRHSVSKPTIRAAYRVLLPYLERFVPQSFGDTAIWKTKLRFPAKD